MTVPTIHCLSELQITEISIQKYNVLVFILSMIYTQSAISLIDGFIIQFKMHKDSCCYLTLTIIYSCCSTLLSLSIASKISYLNLQDSKRKVRYLLTPHIALLNVCEQPAYLPADVFKYSIKIGQESTPIQINTQLNEGFALNS